MDKAYRDIDISALSEKILADSSELELFRNTRLEMVRECAGHRYGGNAARQKVKLNLMSLYQATVGRGLVSKAPRVYLSTFNPSQRATVNAMEKWCNREIERMRLADVFQRLVIDAMYGPGIAKISLATPGDAATSAWNQKAGKPRIQRVDLDDFSCDMNAKDTSEVEYMASRIRIPKRVAVSMYGKNKTFNPMGVPDYNRDGDERIGRLTRNLAGFKELEEHIELWEVYLPHHRCIVMLSEDCVYQTGKDPQPLWYQKWIGRESGPYEILGYGVVSGNIMPKAPMYDLFDIHLDYQNVARKANESLRDVKELTGYRRQQDADGKAIQDAKHLHMVGLDDPEAVKQIMTGGKSVQLLDAGAERYKQNFSYMGANLELLGGRSQQASTKGQEELLQQNSSASIADMQDRTTAFVEQCLKSFLWYAWSNPEEIHEVSISPPGLPYVTASNKIYPGSHKDQKAMRRVGDFNDLDMKIVPYSMQSQTPAQMLAFLNSVVDRMGPMMPLLQSQGIMFDANFWLTEIGKLGDAPDLGQIFTIQEPPAQEGNELPHTTTMPANTNRTVTRRNVSERTQGGSAEQMIAAGMDLGGDSGEYQ